MGDVSFWKLVGRALVYKMINVDLDTLTSLSENGKQGFELLGLELLRY